MLAIVGAVAGHVYDVLHEALEHWDSEPLPRSLSPWLVNSLTCISTWDYWEFVELITARPGKVSNLEDYLKIMHVWTERLQSSPVVIERSVYEVIGKEYRSSRVTQMERG